MSKKNICKKVCNFHHYLTWFLAPRNEFALRCKTKHLAYILFKMRLKDKTYSIMYLIVNSLQLKMLIINYS